MLLPVMKGMLFVGSKFGFLSCGPNPCAVSSSSPPHPPDSPHADRQELRSGLINAIRLFFLFFFFFRKRSADAVRTEATGDGANTTR